MKNIDKQILRWFDAVKRPLPWRENQDFYSVWISEIMLQQTRVNQMIGYYNRFMTNFPTLKNLAQASEEEVLKNWEGLGYYSRARNLHFTAQYIYDECKGVAPSNFQDLKKLKGIGEYTAAAIASICYNEPVVAVDGNVFRVLSRYLGIEDDIAQPKTRSLFFALGNELISKENPGDFNQALMELGATVCLPKNPKCEECPIAESCFALENQMVAKLPVKNKKINQTTRFLNYFVINDSLVFSQRIQNDIWKNMYELPLYETTHNLEIIEEINGFAVSQSSLLQTMQHKLTHQTLHIQFWKITVSDEDFEQLSSGKIQHAVESNFELEVALPRPIVLFLDKIKTEL